VSFAMAERFNESGAGRQSSSRNRCPRSLGADSTFRFARAELEIFASK
jgi:hypothetical protein